MSASLMDYTAAAEYLHLSRSKLAGLKACGAIPHVQIGRRVLFAVADLDAFIARNRVEAVGA